MNSEKTTTILLIVTLVLNLVWNTVRKQVKTEAENILEVIENQNG